MKIMSLPNNPLLLIHLREVKPEADSQATIFSRLLQVQTLWLTLSLRLKNTFSCSSEVLHVDTHTTFPKSHETSFRADSLDIGTGKVVLLVDELVKIDVLVEGHL